MIATVYGRFHYVLNTLAGAALAIAVVAAHRYLSGGESPSTRRIDGTTPPGGGPVGDAGA